MLPLHLWELARVPQYEPPHQDSVWKSRCFAYWRTGVLSFPWNIQYTLWLHGGCRTSRELVEFIKICLVLSMGILVSLGQSPMFSWIMVLGMYAHRTFSTRPNRCQLPMKHIFPCVHSCCYCKLLVRVRLVELWTWWNNYGSEGVSCDCLIAVRYWKPNRRVVAWYGGDAKRESRIRTNSHSQTTTIHSCP